MTCSCLLKVIFRLSSAKGEVESGLSELVDLYCCGQILGQFLIVVSSGADKGFYFLSSRGESQNIRGNCDTVWFSESCVLSALLFGRSIILVNNLVVFGFHPRCRLKIIPEPSTWLPFNQRWISASPRVFACWFSFVFCLCKVVPAPERQ